MKVASVVMHNQQTVEHKTVNFRQVADVTAAQWSGAGTWFFAIPRGCNSTETHDVLHVGLSDRCRARKIQAISLDIYAGGWLHCLFALS